MIHGLKVLKHFSKSECLFSLGFLVLFIAFIIIDIFHSLKTHPLGAEILIEAPIMAMGIIGIIFFIRKLRRERTDHELAKKRVFSLNQDLQQFKLDSAIFLNDFNLYIIKQFDKWMLSPSEKEVGLLLLKGLSFKEIADLRSTSEKTIRNQAVSIYNRSGQSGRHEFAAFFLKDLILTPSERQKINARP
jgi:DNA-binding CsgD family transcriptional regulator